MNLYALAAAAIPAGYQFTSIVACLQRLRFRQTLTGYEPPVSILKPIRGADPGFYEAIRSQSEIDYPNYEILFGVGDDGDTALPHIRRLQAEFPRRQIRVVNTSTETLNGKVGSLIDLERAAQHDFLVISDADIRVGPDYLRKVIAPLQDPSIGLVTCLYRAHASTFAGIFEAIGVETDFAPSALVAPLVGVDEFAFGSTICVRRADLARAGGLAPIAGYIADDYQIGKRIHALGLKCVLGEPIVDTHLGAPDFAAAWRHQVRWARTIRVSRTGGFMGLFVTFATFWALVLATAGQWPLAAALLSLRLLGAMIAAVLVMKSRQSTRYFWLMPFRDLSAVLVWIAGLMPGPVEWRGRRMTLSSDGRIRDPGSSSSSQA